MSMNQLSQSHIDAIAERTKEQVATLGELVALARN